MHTLGDQLGSSFPLVKFNQANPVKRHAFHFYLAFGENLVALSSLWLFGVIFQVQYSATLHYGAFVACAILTGAWSGQVLRDATQGFVASTRAVLLAVPGYVLVDAVLEDSVSIITLIAATGILLPLLLGFRWLFRKVVIGQRARGRFLDGAVLVGTKDEVNRLSESLELNRDFGYKIVAVAILPSSTEPNSVRQSSDFSLKSKTVIDLVETSRASCVFLGLQATKNSEFLEELIWDAKASHVEIYLSRPLGTVSHSSFQIVSSLGKLMLRLDDRVNTQLSKISKRVFDILIGSMLLLMSLPMQVVICLLILLIDKQFPLYAQKRVGVGGRYFWIYKFRTMKGNHHSEVLDGVSASNRAGNEVQFKLKRDPRVTPLGKTLRRFSLDEFPQLFNVMSGSMSLVGPRPHVPAEVEEYDQRAARRLLIKPGMTGAWQISGRSDLSWEDSIQLDLNYVQNWSLVLDFVILVKTVWAVIRGKGAY